MQEQFEYKSSNLGHVGPKSSSLNLDEAQGIVECFVAGIGNKDSVGDIVATGAFTKSLQRRKPRVVWGHNWNDPIGKVLEIYEVPASDPRLPIKMKVAGIGGLFAKVQFNLNSEKGKEAFANVAFFGEEQEWSIGYKTLRAQYDQKSQANVIFELELYEVSPVLHGANQLTGTISVKTDMLLEQQERPVAVPTVPPSAQLIDREELQKQLSNMYGGKINVVEADDATVTFVKPNEKGGYEKYKCHWMRNGGTFMFGNPQRIVIPQETPQQPQVVVSPSPQMPQTQPQRIVRPQQMPAIPVAVKPNPIGPGTVMVPLPRIEYEGNTPEVDKNNLDKEEAELRDSLLKIVKRYGKFNEDGTGVWAGYYPPEKNPVAGIGVKCANCVLYNGGSSCQIISLPVHPEGKCRFAVIPNGVVKGYDSDKKAAEKFESDEQEDYLIELEVKYPGELLIAGLRGAVGRLKKKKKIKKYKDLAEFNEEEIDEKGYCIGVDPSDAFMVKQILDPIFDYYRAETFVDIDGIVINSGVSYELIEAVDTALQNNNIKKKLLVSDDVEVKNLGRRLASYGASRLIDRPNLGGGRRRSGVRGFGVPEGDLNPDTRVDKNRNGWLFDNIPGWEQRDPTPYGPGSIYNADLTPEQIRDGDKIGAEGQAIEGDIKPIETDAIRMPVVGEPEPKYTSGLAKPEESRVVPLDKKPKPQKPKFNEERRLKSARNLSRHGLGKEHEKNFGVSRDEKQRREDFDKKIQNWVDSGFNWEQYPRLNSDKNVSENYLRGREMGKNQARVAWRGTGRGNGKRPDNFNEKNKSSNEYADWFFKYAGHLGNFARALDSSKIKDREEFNKGVKKGISEHFINNIPDTSTWDIEKTNKFNNWMKKFGYDTNVSDGRLSSGGLGERTYRGRTEDVPGLDEGFDPDNPFGDENMPYDLGFDVYDKIIEEFLGEETPEELRAKPGKTQVWSDEEIYRRRMNGATLQDVAETLGWTRQEVRQAEQRHMFFLRNGQKIERPKRFDKPRKRRKAEKEKAKALKEKQKLDAAKAIAEQKEKEAAEKLAQEKLDREDYGRLSSGVNKELDEVGPVGYILSQVSPKRAERLSSGADLNEQELEKYYENMRSQILSSIETALKNPNLQFARPWARTDNYARNPTNKRRNTVGRAYEGSGQLILSMKAFMKKYPVARWAGEKQWREIGGRIRKGEPPTEILAPTIVNGKRTGDFHMTKVWNIAQVDGLPPAMYKAMPDKISEEQRVANIQSIINEVGPVVEEGNFGGAFFANSRDTIFMPKFGQFNSAVDYYAVLMHELTHWTGHQSRLGRRFGKMRAPESSADFKQYAFEELIAEIGSALIMGMLGITHQFRQDHGTYLKEWASQLRGDPTSIRRAMLEAQKAVNFLLNRSATLRRLGGFEPNERRSEKDLKFEIPLIEGMVDSPSIPRSGAIRGTFEMPIDELEDDDNSRLSSGKIEDFATRPHKAGKTHKIGTRGWSAIDRQNGDREVYHYSTMMGVIRDGQYFEISTGWDSVSDKQGIKKILKALGQKEPRKAEEMEMLSRLSSGKIEDFANRPHVPGRKIKAGSGGAWSSVDLSNGDREIYHYSTKMGFIRNGLFHQESDGWGSVSDKQGINKILRALRQPNAIRIQQTANLDTDDETRFVSLARKDENGKVIDVTGRLSSGGGYIESRKNPKDKNARIKRADNVSFQLALGLAHEPTQQQKDVLETGIAAISGQLKPYKNKQGRMVFPVISVQAAAGTGKTTTLKMLAKALDNLFNIEIGNESERKEKLEYISQRFGIDFSKLTDKQIKETVAKLKEDYGSRSLYYAVFNVKNQEEAQSAFPQNTGVSTLDKMARWGIQMGAADEKFGDHIRRKLEAAGARIDRARDFDDDGNPIGGSVDTLKKDGSKYKFTYIDYRTGERKETAPHPTVRMRDDSGPAAQKPTLEHTGLITLETTSDYVKFFKLDKLKDVPGSERLRNLDGTTLGEIIRKAVEKWALSTDEQLSAKHFAQDADEIEGRESGYVSSIIAGQARLNLGYEPLLDEFGNPVVDADTGKPKYKQVVGEIGSEDFNPQFWVDVFNDPENNVPEAWVKMAQTAVEHLTQEFYTDEKGKKQKTVVLPSQGQIAKLFALSNPDLSEAKYMVGHALGISRRDAVRSTAKVGDITDIDGNVIKDVSKIDRDTPLWIVTSINNKAAESAKKGKKEEDKISRTVNIRRVFAHPRRKLNALLIDEAQDLNPTFMQVLENNRDKFPILLVGDERQSVYNFRNAVNAMDLMDPDYVLPLNESFRFGKNIAHVGNIIQALLNLDDEQLALIRGEEIPRRQWVTGHHHELVSKQFDDVIEMLEKFDSLDDRDKTKLTKILIALDEEFKLSKEFTTKTKQKEDVLIYDENIPAKEKIKFLTNRKESAVKESEGRIHNRMEFRLDEKGKKIPMLDADGQPLRDEKHEIVYERVGELTPKLGETYAFLAGTNEEIINKAFALVDLMGLQADIEHQEWISRNPGKTPPPVLVPQVAIAPKKYEDILAFLKHYKWVLDNEKSGGINKRKKPPMSSFIGNVWTREGIKREALRPGKTQLRTMWKIVNPTGKKPRPIWELISQLEGGYFRTGVNGPDGKPVLEWRDAIIIPERRALQLDTSFNKLHPKKGKGEWSIEELTTQPSTKLNNRTDSTDTSLFKVSVIQGRGQGDEAQRSDVHWHLEMEQQDNSGKWKVIDGTWAHDVKKPGRWTGRVLLTGQGLSSSKQRGSGKGKPRPAGYYQEDVKRIISRNPRFAQYFDFEPDKGAIRRSTTTAGGLSKEQAAAATARNDQWAIDISRVGGSEERLSEIIQEVSTEILKAAKTTGADAQITTAQLFKGMEAHTVVLGESFQNAFAEERENFKKVGIKSPQMREILNTAYVALTRAQKQLDMGQAVAEMYFREKNLEKALKHIDDEVKKLRASGNAEDIKLADAIESPKDFVYGTPDEDAPAPIPSQIDDDNTLVDMEAEGGDAPTAPKDSGEDGDGSDFDVEDIDEDNLAGKEDIENESGYFSDPDRVSSGRENYIAAVVGRDGPTPAFSKEAQKIWDTNFAEQINRVIENNNQNDVLSIYSRISKAQIAKTYKRKNASAVLPSEPDGGIDYEYDDADMGLYDITEKDLEKANKLISQIGQASNVAWALKNANNDNSSPKTQTAAKKILNDAKYNRLSSGRADRRVIKSLDDVRENMQYDHSRAADYKMTDEQINISDAVMTGDNVVVRALAGTGKTSTLLATAKRLLDQEPDKRVVYLTFTRKMAEEAKEKFKDFDNVEVRTWDSVGTTEVIGTSPKLRLKQNSQNPGIIGVNNNNGVADHYGFKDDFEEIKVKNSQGDLVPLTVGLTRRQRAALMARAATEFSTGKNPDTGKPHTEMTKYLIRLAAGKMGMGQLSDRQIGELVRDAQKFWDDSFDENSPLELSRSYVLKKWSLTNPDLGTGRGMKKNVDGNDIIFFDEAQDANPVMTDVIRNQKIQWIAVGDSNQAIYEFRGAVDELEDLDAPHQLTLTKTFRFGREVQGVANRFLKAHEVKLTDEDGNVPSFAQLRIDAAGPSGSILASEDLLPEGITTAATRATKKNGKKETFAYLTQTNAKAFERIITAQEAGQTTGSTSTFKNDLTGMIDHMEWLQGGKQTEKPKNVFPPLWSVKTWDELVKAAGPTGAGGPTTMAGDGEGTPFEIDSVEAVDVNQQALTAFRLFAKYNFNWAKMRQHVKNIETLDGGELINRKITAADLADEFEPVEIVDGGVLVAVFNPRTNEIVLNKDGGDWDQYRSYAPLIKDKYKFYYGDPSGKYRKTEKAGYHLKVADINAAVSVLNNLAKDIEMGIATGDSPEFASIQSFTPIVEGNGNIFNYLSGAKYSYFDKFKKRQIDGIVRSDITLRFKKADGKFIAVADGNTFNVKELLKAQDPKTKKSTFVFSSKDKPLFGEPAKWIATADTVEELYEKLENLRKVHNVSGGDYLLKPTAVKGAQKGVDIVAQTAHRSKGLEFDNVVLAGDFKAPKWDELAAGLIEDLYKQGRIDTKEFDSLKDFLEVLTPEEQKEFKKKVIKSMGAEEIRLQYVAATRAMQRLVPGSTSWIFDVTDDDDEEFTQPTTPKPKVSRRRAERKTDFPLAGMKKSTTPMHRCQQKKNVDKTNTKWDSTTTLMN